MSFSADEQDERSLRYAGWRVALAASGCVFVSFASLLVFTFSVFLKPLTREFGWSRESASLAFAIAAMTVAVCSPPLGFLLDRYPARRIMLPCIVIFVCAFASLSLLTPHLWHLYAVFFVLGAVGNGTAQLASSRAVTTWFQERRGVALARCDPMMTGGSIGVMSLATSDAGLDRRYWQHSGSRCCGFAKSHQRAVQQQFRQHAHEGQSELGSGRGRPLCQQRPGVQGALFDRGPSAADSRRLRYDSRQYLTSNHSLAVVALNHSSGKNCVAFR